MPLARPLFSLPGRIWIFACLVFSVLFFAAHPGLTAMLKTGERHPSWSQQDVKDFFSAMNAAGRSAKSALRTSGWRVNWRVGSREFDPRKSTHMLYRTRISLEQTGRTNSQVRMMLYLVRHRSAANAIKNTGFVNRTFLATARKSNAYVKNELVKQYDLGLGNLSSLLVFRATGKLGLRGKDGKKKFSSKTSVAATAVANNWSVIISEAHDEAAVKAVMTALYNAYSGARQSISTPVSPSKSTESRKPDKAGVKIRLANPKSGELEDFENFFYAIKIPYDKRMLVLNRPDRFAGEVTRLRNGARNIRIKKLDRVKGRLWANICGPGYCGWAVAKHLRRQRLKSVGRRKYIEAMYPEINVFARATVNSRKLRSLFARQRVELIKTIYGEDGYKWVRICGRNWCGWATSEFFKPVK